MFKMLVVFMHLLGVCLALGTIFLTDLRLLARVSGYGVTLNPPDRFEARLISLALALLYATGAVIVALGLADNPDYLLNQKLQAKLVLVLLLTLNAVLLHHMVFPLLKRARPVSHWSRAERLKVALVVGLSNSLWLYCSFLGTARAWNHTMALYEVLLVGLAAWAAVATAVAGVLTLARRDVPRGDWVDTVKGRLSGLAPLDSAGRPSQY